MSRSHHRDHDGRRLFALDRRTGKLCRGFGKRGFVNLLEGLGKVDKGTFTETSPPAIVGDTIVLGGAVPDNGKLHNPSGVIRAFDAVTGSFRWAWDIGRPGRAELPGPGEEYARGTPNAWAPLSADPALGLVFVPTGNSSPDNFGAGRSPEEEKYSSAVVALDAATGAVRWSFQTVHHDLWDYDVASQPVLADFPTAGGMVPAVIQATKRGEVFVLDRRTGKPLTKVVEKAGAAGRWQGRLDRQDPALLGGDAVVRRSAGDREVDVGSHAAGSALVPCPIPQGAQRRPVHAADRRQALDIQPGLDGRHGLSSVSVDPDRNIMVATTMHISNYDRFVTQEEAKAHPEIKKDATLLPGLVLFRHSHRLFPFADRSARRAAALWPG